MANTNYHFDPNARYDTGPNTAGSGRVPNQTALQAASPTGLGSNGVLANGRVATGFNAAGTPKNNPGPNVAGAQRSYNNT